MSITVLPPADDDFDDFEFAAIVADFDVSVPDYDRDDLPEPDPSMPVSVRRRPRAAERRAAINESLRRWER